MDPEADEAASLAAQWAHLSPLPSFFDEVRLYPGATSHSAMHNPYDSFLADQRPRPPIVAHDVRITDMASKEYPPPKWLFGGRGKDINWNQAVELSEAFFKLMNSIKLRSSILRTLESYDQNPNLRPDEYHFHGNDNNGPYSCTRCGTLFSYEVHPGNHKPDWENYWTEEEEQDWLDGLCYPSWRQLCAEYELGRTYDIFMFVTARKKAPLRFPFKYDDAFKSYIKSRSKKIQERLVRERRFKFYEAKVLEEASFVPLPSSPAPPEPFEFVEP